MVDDILMTLIFWLVAIALILCYVAPVALTVTGGVLLKTRPKHRTLGLVMVIIGVLLGLSVILWRVF
jgi:hypothetical protein